LLPLLRLQHLAQELWPATCRRHHRWRVTADTGSQFHKNRETRVIPRLAQRAEGPPSRYHVTQAIGSVLRHADLRGSIARLDSPAFVAPGEVEPRANGKNSAWIDFAGLVESTTRRAFSSFAQPSKFYLVDGAINERNIPPTFIFSAFRRLVLLGRFHHLIVRGLFNSAAH
jgi:hypothetical protein